MGHHRGNKVTCDLHREFNNSLQTTFASVWLTEHIMRAAENDKHFNTTIIVTELKRLLSDGAAPDTRGLYSLSCYFHARTPNSTFCASDISLNTYIGRCAGNITLAPGSRWDSQRLALGLLRSIKRALRVYSRWSSEAFVNSKFVDFFQSFW